jgi:hypothetical protein
MPGMRCVLPPHGIGTLVRLSMDPPTVLVRIDTPGLIIEREASGFSMTEVETQLEISIPIEQVTSKIRPIASFGLADDLARDLQSRMPTEPLPERFQDRLLGLREAFDGPLDVSVRWLKRFRASDSSLSFGERRALRILERLVAKELELARSSIYR